MISEKKEKAMPVSSRLLKMKGQAIPLFGYHILRDCVLKEITSEYQSSILYWAGRNLANSFEFTSFEDCRDLFLEMGWGNLEKEHSTSHTHRYTLESPFFSSRSVELNESTFALECGFLSHAVSVIEQRETEGDFKPYIKNDFKGIQFTIYLQRKGEA